MYGLKRIPLTVLNEVIEVAYFPEEHESPTLVLVSKKFNETLDGLKEYTASNSRIVGDGAISLKEITDYIDLQKSAFINAQNAKPEDNE